MVGGQLAAIGETAASAGYSWYGRIASRVEQRCIQLHLQSGL